MHIPPTGQLAVTGPPTEHAAVHSLRLVRQSSTAFWQVLPLPLVQARLQVPSVGQSTVKPEQAPFALQVMSQA